MENNFFQQTRFICSAVNHNQYPLDEGDEIAVIGRSNAGKSSAINAICMRRALAKTSKTPGRTQTINFFEVVSGKRLVDLPGYGYANVSAAQREKWSEFIASYFSTRCSLRGVVIVMDARHPMTQSDRQVLVWLRSNTIHVLLSKSDKLKRGEAQHCLAAMSDALQPYRASVQLFSSLKKQGVEEAKQKLMNLLGCSPP